MLKYILLKATILLLFLSALIWLNCGREIPSQPTEMEDSYIKCWNCGAKNECK